MSRKLIVGRVTRDSAEYQRGLLDLCGDAREIFTEQPTRCFLHGFYVHGSMVELWVFDRVSLYCCEAFDFNKELHRFVTTLVGYTMMSDAELGLNPLIKADAEDMHITIRDDLTAKPVVLHLAEPAIASPKNIIYDGPTCYRATAPGSHTQDLVVKFVWRRDTARPEERLLKMAVERHVWESTGFMACRAYAAAQSFAKGCDSAHRDSWTSLRWTETTRQRAGLVAA